MTNGQVQASAGVQLSGVYPPQGVIASTNPLKNFTILQSFAASLNLTYGTGSGKVNLIVCSDHTLTAAGGLTPTATYDLYTGTDLPDLDGLTAAFRIVRYVAVHVVTGGDTLGMQVGGAASDTWGSYFVNVNDKALVFPNGVPYQGGSPAGVAVGTTTKNFLIENLGAVAVTFRIVVAGSAST